MDRQAGCADCAPVDFLLDKLDDYGVGRPASGIERVLYRFPDHLGQGIVAKVLKGRFGDRLLSAVKERKVPVGAGVHVGNLDLLLVAVLRLGARILRARSMVGSGPPSEFKRCATDWSLHPRSNQGKRKVGFRAERQSGSRVGVRCGCAAARWTHPFRAFVESCASCSG